MMRTNEEKPYFFRLFNIKKVFKDSERIIAGPWICLLHRTKVVPVGEGAKDSLKWTHGALVASDHVSHSDPFIVSTAFWQRRMRWIAAEVVMDKPILGFLLRLVGCIRIDRHKADMKAIKKIVHRLKRGDMITIYAQGGIKKDEDIKGLKDGPAFIAMQANVPLIPCFLKKRDHWWQRQKAYVGPMIFPKDIIGDEKPNAKSISKLTETLEKEMNKLKEKSNED